MSLRPSERVGRYRILRSLAMGGQATVFLARVEGQAGTESAASFSKLFALKCIHPHLTQDPKLRAMFAEEARIASQITHPNVCSVFDFGEQDALVYLVMEYLHGCALSTVFEALDQNADLQGSERLPYIAARVGAEVAEGLHAAHELKGPNGELLQVVHRDVSPQNIFLTYDGAVRVVDFGIARAVGRAYDTTTGTVRGKAAYMPPEQLMGQDVDRTADVWALGVTLWEFLTGKTLFPQRGTTFETIRAVCEADIPSPSTHNPNIDAELDRIVTRALSRPPHERYATAREMGAALHQYLADAGAVVGLPQTAHWLQELFPERASVPDVREPPTDAQAIAGAPTTPAEAMASSPPSDVALKARVPASKRAVWIVGFGALLVGAGLLGRYQWGAEPAAGASNVESRVSPTATRAAANRTAAASPPPGPVAPVPGSKSPPVLPQDGALDSPSLPPTAPAPVPAQQKGPSVPTKRPRPRAAASGPASLNVSTPGGWADIFVEGKPMGRTPARLELASGRRRLELRPFGRTPALRRTVRLRPHESKRLVIPLTGRGAESPR